MKKIYIITTGGTLASSNCGNGLSPSLTSKEVVHSLSEITRCFQIEFLDLFSLDSANIQVQEWQLLASKIYEVKDRCDGIVVIHGTDTMAYTASMISFMIQGITIPVVFTGSQLPIINPIADAMENCRCAIHMAGSGVPGFFIAFNRKVILGVRAAKIRTVSFDAFESISFPNVAEINSKGLQIHQHLLPTESICRFREKICQEVFLLKLIPGIRKDVFSMITSMGYRGIVVEAFGTGGIPFFPNDLTEEIRKIVEQGVTVLVKSQCIYEGSNLNIYETGKKAIENGALQAYDMTTEAAVTKLMWVLGQTSDKNKIAEYFERNICNEVTICS